MKLRQPGGRTAIHFSTYSRHTLHSKSIELSDGQSGLSDQIVNPAIQIAAAADDVLNGIESVLPAGNLLVVAPTMFQKEKPAFRSQNTPYFCKRR